MSDYLAKETPDPREARLVEEAEESSEEKKKGEDKDKLESKDPKKSAKTESNVIGADPSKQRVITYEQLQEEKKKTKPFRSRAGMGELQQEV